MVVGPPVGWFVCSSERLKVLLSFLGTVLMLVECGGALAFLNMLVRLEQCEGHEV